MILVDTSVWIDHLRRRDPRLVGLLEGAQVLAHPFVIGEVALGSLRDRAAVVGALSNLSSSAVATHQEFLSFRESEGLAGTGIGYVDAHLLASARLAVAQF